MTANSASRTSPTGGIDKPRLTDAEKKQNHILSEQKRRQAIRQGFDRLAAMTPGMDGMGRSEATVLSHATAELKLQLAMKAAIKRKLFAENPNMTEEFFESLYEVSPTPVFAPQQPNSPAASTGSGSGSGSASKAKAKKAKEDN